MEKSRQNIIVQRWVVGVAAILFIFKLAAYYLTQSVAILTDALESTVNVIAGVIGLYSLHLAAKPRDTDHPYGHGKAEFLSAAVEGALVVMAGLIIIYEAIIDFVHPHPLQRLDKGLYLIAFTAVVNFAVGTVCVVKGRRNNSVQLVAGGRHLQTDTYSTAGVIIGLILILYTHLTWIDGVVSIIIAAIILYTGYHILRRSVAGIMDEADVQLLHDMVSFINKHRRENWIDLHNLRVIKYGSVLHVDCHLTVPWYLNVLEAHEEVDALTGLIRSTNANDGSASSEPSHGSALANRPPAGFGESMEFFVHTDPCYENSCHICTKQRCPVRKHAFEERVEWTFNNAVANKRHESPRVAREQLHLEFPEAPMRP